MVVDWHTIAILYSYHHDDMMTSATEEDFVQQSIIEFRASVHVCVVDILVRRKFNVDISTVEVIRYSRSVMREERPYEPIHVCLSGSPLELGNHMTRGHCWIYCCNNVNLGHCWDTLLQQYEPRSLENCSNNVNRGYCWLTLLQQWHRFMLLQYWPWISLLPLILLLHLLFSWSGREERLLNFSALQRVYLSNLVWNWIGRLHTVSWEGWSRKWCWSVSCSDCNHEMFLPM
jgi:hypothetical protein